MIAFLTAGLLALGCVKPQAAEQPEPLPASDWITMGLDCAVFAAGDVDGDGWADFLTINGNRDLCVARSVNGWKSAAWAGIAGDVSPTAVGMLVIQRETGAEVVVVEESRVVILGAYADGKLATRRTAAAPAGRKLVRLDASDAAAVVVVDEQGGRWRVEGESLVNVAASAGNASLSASSVAAITPPPHDNSAEVLAQLRSGFAPSGGELAWTVFKTSRPSRHLAVRVAVVKSPDPADSDLDGLSDASEKTLGTDPRHRDTDDDGLLDGWEVHGLPGVDLGPRISLYAPGSATEQRETQLSPLRQDVLVAVSYFEGIDIEAFRGNMPRIDVLYRRLGNTNPDGSTGIRIHFIELPGTVAPEDAGRHWAQNGGKYRPAAWRGMVHWMQVTPGGGGQSSQTGDMGSCGNGWAVFAHELGHQLSLSHSGDSSPGLCPLYPSLMNYAYNYAFDGDGNAVHFSDGGFREHVLDERKLVEELPFAFEQVKFLANHPFRFTLKPGRKGTTLIDWNHNGVFDKGMIEADINYGYATHAGDRKTHELIGSAPSLAYVGETCLLAAANHAGSAVTIKAYLGDTKWSPPVAIPDSATDTAPVLAGGDDGGAIFFRTAAGWHVARVTASGGAPVVASAQALEGLPPVDLSAVRVGERYLLVLRHADDRLEARWLTLGAAAELSGPIELEAKSQVPVGLTRHPGGGSIAMVGAGPDEKGGPFRMQVVTLAIRGSAIRESAPVPVNDRHAVHCTSRPVPVYRGKGREAQLAIFHTGLPDGGGTWTAYRTLQVKNKSLNGGWLTCQMYDEWTRSRVAAGFADGPQGAIYAFRWDPGDHGEWKVNTMIVAHEGWGIDTSPMRDFNDAAQMSEWGIRHSILTLQRE